MAPVRQLEPGQRVGDPGTCPQPSQTANQQSCGVRVNGASTCSAARIWSKSEGWVSGTSASASAWPVATGSGMKRSRAYAAKPPGPNVAACHHDTPEAPSQRPSPVREVQVIATQEPFDRGPPGTEKSAGCLNPRAVSLRTLLSSLNGRVATAVPHRWGFCPHR